MSRKSTWSRNHRCGYRLRIRLREKEKFAECQVEIASLNAGLFRYTHQGCSKSSQFLASGKTLKLLGDKFLAALTVGKTPAETILKHPSPRNRAHPPLPLGVPVSPRLHFRSCAPGGCHGVLPLASRGADTKAGNPGSPSPQAPGARLERCLLWSFGALSLRPGSPQPPPPRLAASRGRIGVHYPSKPPG